MLGALIGLAVVLLVVFRAMTGEERVTCVQTARAWIDWYVFRRPDEYAVFQEALRGRHPRVPVTSIILVANLVSFAWSTVVPAAEGVWGANAGLHTTRGEWWRLATASFSHFSAISLLVNLGGLLQVGRIVERLIGPGPFALAYVSIGLLSNLSTLLSAPSSVTAGASGAVYGVYGMALSAATFGVLRRSSLRMPWCGVKRLMPAAATFVVYTVVNDDVGFAGEAGGLFVGFVLGLIFFSGVAPEAATLRRVAVAASSVGVMTFSSVVRIAGTLDVGPELARVVTLERETAQAYDRAADRFRKREIDASALVAVIDRDIRPRLAQARGRLASLDRVPPEHQSLVADAVKFAELRDDSWRLRAEGLKKLADAPRRASGSRTPSGSPADAPQTRTRAEVQAQHTRDTAILGKAETTEREAHEILARLAAGPAPARP